MRSTCSSEDVAGERPGQKGSVTAETLLHKALSAVRRSLDILQTLPTSHPARIQHELPALVVLQHVAETGATRLFSRAAAIAHQLQLAHVLAAIALHQARLLQGRPEAVSALEEALAVQPTNLPCLLALAVCLGPQSLNPAAYLQRRASFGLSRSGLKGLKKEWKEVQVIDDDEFIDAFKGAAAFAAAVVRGGAAQRAPRIQKFHAVISDLARSQRQISRALSLTSFDVLVWFHQARLHLTRANQRYITIIAGKTQKSSSRDEFHEHEIKALEALVGALSADAPASQLPHGPGRHVPSLLLRGKILLQVLARCSTATISHLGQHPQLLHLPPPPLWASGRSGLQGVVGGRRGGEGKEGDAARTGIGGVGAAGHRQEGCEDCEDKEKYKQEGRMEEQILGEAERCFRTAISCEANNVEALLAWATVLQALLILKSPIL